MKKLFLVGILPFVCSQLFAMEYEDESSESQTLIEMNLTPVRKLAAEISVYKKNYRPNSTVDLARLKLISSLFAQHQNAREKVLDTVCRRNLSGCHGQIVILLNSYVHDFIRGLTQLNGSLIMPPSSLSKAQRDALIEEAENYNRIYSSLVQILPKALESSLKDAPELLEQMHLSIQGLL
jgi:hypothetical protein